MDLSFDTRGNLKPYEKITITFDEFKSYFFEGFENSLTRNEILKNYEQYLEDFKTEVSSNFIQWIDGSFVSNKTNPRDIDFVNLIDFEI
ncbi:MAG: hypothetical protein AAF849_22015 [Bacteroidota bacterium]